jgi:oligopeptide/dipeptide ABC transporter ATP-binding protein
MSLGLEVSDLVVRGGSPRDSAVVGPLEFQVEQGSVIGIVGETGAGKTLTLRALMGLLPDGFSTTGGIRIGASGPYLTKEVQLRAQLGKSVGVVWQNPLTAFDPLKSVGAQVVEGVVRRKMASEETARDRALNLLLEVGFRQPEAVMKLYPNQLSGGMAQRISIVMAVMPGPSVVLADEPTSALDAVLRLGVLALLQGMARTKGSVLLLVSHDLSLVGRFCDRLLVMYRGRAIESGPAESVLSQPRHPYTRALVACSPSVGTAGRRTLASIPGQVEGLFAEDSGCRFVGRCPVAQPICQCCEPGMIDHDGHSTACHVVEQSLASK